MFLGIESSPSHSRVLARPRRARGDPERVQLVRTRTAVCGYREDRASSRRDVHVHHETGVFSYSAAPFRI